eukprot:11446158-Ditylum_brightwellii.AAC.1
MHQQVVMHQVVSTHQHHQHQQLIDASVSSPNAQNKSDVVSPSIQEHASRQIMGNCDIKAQK